MLPSTVDIAARLPGAERLGAIRQAAAERADALGLPSPDAEDWRYSRVDELDIERFTPTTGAASTTAAGPGPGGPWAATVTIVDGHVVAVDAPGPVSVTVAGQGDETADDIVAAALGSVMGEAPDGLVELGVALAPSPVLVSIPRGATPEAPILIRSHVATPDALVASRVVVAAGEGSSARVVEARTSEDVEALVLPLVELDVDTAATLRYADVQQLGPRVWQIGAHISRVGRDASFASAVAGLGGEYARLRTDCRLEGRGASGELLAAYFGAGDQTLDFRTFQDHRAPDTTSELLFKGAVAGRSRSIYTGLIRVRPDARGTNAFQTNRTIKLSDEAWAESVPNLEIQNNDVKCSHASAVGPIDEDQRFYLESRGVPTEVAERLVVAGFFDEVLARVPVPSVVAAVRAEVDERIQRAGLAPAVA